MMSSLPSPMPLSEIVNILKPLSHKYFELGVQLEVEVHLLKGIESIQHHSQSRRLTETIVLWQNNTTIANRASTRDHYFATLADAVERMGGFDNVAQKLREHNGAGRPMRENSQHPIPQQCCDSAESTDDTGYSSKNVDGDSSGSEAETAGFDLASACGCSKDKPCPLYKFCADGCPNPTRKKVCVLRRKSRATTPATRDAIPIEEEPDGLEEYEKSTKNLRKAFGNMILETCRALKRSKTCIQELSLYLQSISPLMKARAEDLSKSNSLESAFIIVGDQACSWFDYEIIKDIAHRFGDSNAESFIEEYERQFKEYTEQRLPKGVRHIEIGGGTGKGGKRLVVKIDKEWEDVTFSDLDKLRESFASILGVRRRDLYLADIQEGCIMMSFVLPEQLAGKLFPTRSCLTPDQVKSFSDAGVILLRCGKLTWRASTQSGNKTRSGDNSVGGNCEKVHVPQDKRNKLCWSLNGLHSIVLILTLLLASAVTVPFVTYFHPSLAESEYKNTTTPVIMTHADVENSLIIYTSVNESTIKQEKTFSVLEGIGHSNLSFFMNTSPLTISLSCGMSPGRLILLYSTIWILGPRYPPIFKMNARRSVYASIITMNARRLEYASIITMNAKRLEYAPTLKLLVRDISNMTEEDSRVQPPSLTIPRAVILTRSLSTSSFVVDQSHYASVHPTPTLIDRGFIKLRIGYNREFRHSEHWQWIHFNAMSCYSATNCHQNGVHILMLRRASTFRTLPYTYVSGILEDSSNHPVSITHSDNGTYPTSCDIGCTTATISSNDVHVLVECETNCCCWRLCQLCYRNGADASIWIEFNDTKGNNDGYALGTKKSSST